MSSETRMWKVTLQEHGESILHEWHYLDRNRAESQYQWAKEYRKSAKTKKIEGVFLNISGYEVTKVRNLEAEIAEKREEWNQSSDALDQIEAELHILLEEQRKERVAR